MKQSRVRRLISALLVLVIGAGGGGLPNLDSLLYHALGRQTEAQVPHYEANSGCHADRCTVRSTAHESRFAPVVPETGDFLPAPERAVVFPLPAFEPAGSSTSQPFSRAPPFVS